jgi:hypothetical protein
MNEHKESYDALVEKVREGIDGILGKDAWTLTNKEYKSEKLTAGSYELVRKASPKTPVARFKLVPMINQCGICVSTEAWVHDDWRNKGLGALLNGFRVDIARLDGYSVLLCTDVESNVYQRKILKSNGWTDIFKFVNKRTHNTVFITVINL